MKYLICLICIMLNYSLAIAQLTGEEIIKESIKFHDPDGSWSSANLILGFIDTRPGKPDRPASLAVNNLNGTFCISRQVGEHKISWHIVNDQCSYEVDGNPQVSEAQREEFNLNKERALQLRNYYLYLWGLPMKLLDPGTIIDNNVTEKKFAGNPAKVVKVTYDDEVGSDTWYFYFNPSSFALMGYQFFHDEDKGDGEYIVLAGLEEVNNIKIPKSRTWYINADSTLLGTDNLVHSFPIHRH